MAKGLGRILRRWFGRREASEPAERAAPEELFRVGDLVLTPASVSRERGAQVLGERGPSQRAALLVVPDAIRDARSGVPEEERDYGPHAEVEWTLDLVWPGPVVVTTPELDEAFDRRASSGPVHFTLYGIPAGASRWTYVHASDAPTRWRAVAASTGLLDPTDGDAEPAGLDVLRSFEADIAARAARIRGATVSAREPAEVAVGRAGRYCAARRDASLDALVVLRARHDGFEGRQVWDSLTSLGLDWGDMDLFHWNNHSDVGHDSFFDVWTSTPPGYFLPERVRAGGVRFDDLVFGFQIARSADPHAVLSQMVEGARHVQGRLGGSLEDERGGPFVEADAHARVRFVVERLAQAGLQPGAETTLRLF